MAAHLEASTPKQATGHPAAGESVSTYRWVVLFFAWGALFLTFVDRLAWSTLAPLVGTSLNMAVGALGVFVTAFYVGYVISNFAGGIATDLLGPRRTLALSLLPLGVCTFLFGQVESVTTGLVIQALMGLAAGCDYSACVKLITAWFGPKNRGLAMGVLMTATSLPLIVINILIPHLLMTQHWGQVYQDLGVVTTIFGVCCFFAVRDGPLVGAVAKQDFKLAALFENRDLLLLAVSGFGAMWGTWGFTFWANALMVKGHGLTLANAASIAALFGVGAVISKPLIGLVSDWAGGRRKFLIMACFVSFSAHLLVFGTLDSEQEFRWIAPFIGVACFAYSPLTAALVAEIAGRALAGSATGAINALWQLGVVTVPLAVGAVFQSTHSFFAAFATLAVGPAFAAVVLIFVKESKRF